MPHVHLLVADEKLADAAAVTKAEGGATFGKCTLYNEFGMGCALPLRCKL